MVPVRPGGHIKTDPRDATTLAALYRASDRLSRPIHSAENNRRSQPQNIIAVHRWARRPVRATLDVIQRATGIRAV